MKKSSLRVYLLAMLFAGSYAVMLQSCSSDKNAKEMPPPPVEVIKVQASDIPIYTEFVGQIYGQSDIAIRARVEGFLESMHFTEGSRVEKGQLLYTIDPEPFEATVAARMSDVASAQTQLVKADNDLKRIRPLAEKNAVSQSDLDAAVANYDAAQASVEAAKANLDAAKIQLGYTKIYSPVSGIIGISEARVGDFVGQSPNPVVLNEVSDIDRVKVRFSLSESDYLKMAQYISSLDSAAQQLRIKNKEKSDNYLEMILSDGEIYPLKGKFDFVDRNVDPTTGSITVQASFPNPKRILRPGMFAKIKAQIENLTNAIKVPQRSIKELQGIHQVVLVDQDSTIKIQEVTVGPKVGSDWVIFKGLEPGQTIIYEGLQKVSTGMKVMPKIVDPESTTNK